MMKERVRQPQLESLMTARQVAEFLQVSVCTIGRWSRQGTLRFYRVGGRGDMRYRVEDVFSFLDESSIQPGRDDVDEIMAVQSSQPRLPVVNAKAGHDKRGRRRSREMDLAQLLQSH